MENASMSVLSKSLDLKSLSKFKVLDENFYTQNTLVVSQRLLGKIILSRSKQGVCAGMITETEAYFGDDPASHSYKGITKRCAPMFEHPAKAYVYCIYGMYEMLNFVTEKKGTPGAVLIRAIEPIFGIELMFKRRRLNSLKNLTNGPGKCARALGVKMSDNRASLMGPKFQVLDFKNRSKLQILSSPRVGIKQGREAFYRFFIKDHPFVSSVKENKLAIACIKNESVVIYS